MKIIVTILATNLVTNLHECLSRPFVETKKKESNFQQVGDLLTRNIYFLFIARRALFQRYAEFNRISLHVNSARIMVSCI